ncbi:ABC transporter substrate-binding protein, partial [Acidilobus sp.]|uniref:ABC transporter substrate-binding protein n=1 Tax=Acidilobus sp. TaxID=1872109 RepID=UPI003D0713F8
MKGRSLGFLGIAVIAVFIIAMAGYLAPAVNFSPVRAQTTTSLISLPPDQTVYAGGVSWSPITTLNPFSTANVIDAMELGMVYLPLFLWSPVTLQYYPALGENFTVTSVTVPASMVYGPNATGTVERAALLVWIWPNATWQDGQPVTAGDVAFTYYLGKYYPSLAWGWMWSPGPGALLNVTPVNDKEVEFIFNSSPSSPPWGNILAILTSPSYPVLPLHEFYPSLSAFFANASKWSPITWNPNTSQVIGDGPYEIYAYTPSEVVFKKWSGWWGWNIWNVSDNGAYAPTYLADVVITSNPQAISMFESGEMTWGGYFLTNVWQLRSNGIYTYLSHAPWNLQEGPWVTLLINEMYPPYNITLVRRAIAYAINTEQLAQVGENGQEEPANISNGFGFFAPYNIYSKAWGKYINMSIVQKYGWTFNLTEAKLLMDEVAKEYGWHMNSQGYWVTPQGWVVNATIIVPYGWTDWMTDAQLIAQNLSKIGIDASTVFPSYSQWYSDVAEGEYSMSLMWSWSGVIPNTWFEYFLWTTGTAPVGSWAWADMERFNNTAAWQAYNDMREIFTINPDNMSALMPLYDNLLTILLNYTPVIPLLTNGIWYEYSTTYWQGWPNETTGYLFPPAPWDNPGNAYVLVHLYPKGATITTTTSTTPTTTTTTSATTTTTSTTPTTTTTTSATTTTTSTTPTTTTTTSATTTTTSTTPT